MPNLRPVRLAILLVAVLACRPGAVASSSAGRLSDARVAGVVLVANNVEVGYALLVPDRAGDAEVRTYALRMRTDHASLAASLGELLARLNVTAEDDPSGIALRDASAPRRERLRTLRGHAFDVAYLDAELATHRELLATLDALLAGGVRRDELREYVTQLRPVVRAHIAHAEQLRVTVADRQR